MTKLASDSHFGVHDKILEHVLGALAD